MSVKCPCVCPGSRETRMGSWAVNQLRYNRTAANDYQPYPSAYSEVVCLRCLGRWRTKAAYVDLLPLTPSNYVRCIVPPPCKERSGGR